MEAVRGAFLSSVRCAQKHPYQTAVAAKSCAVRRLEAVIDNRGKCWAQHHPIPSGKAFRSFAPDGGRADALIFIMRASSTSRNVGSFDVSSPAPWPQSPNREFRDVNPQVVVQELDC